MNKRKIETGFSFYGQRVGILVFSTTGPRIPGDAGNAVSFSYPVQYQVVQGGFADLIEGSVQIKQNILDAVRLLKERGARAIIGDCGLMSRYQQDIAAEGGIITAASALCQIPMVWQLIGRKGSIGIITGHSKLLKEDHLLASGWKPEMSLVIQGMEEENHFEDIVIKGGHKLDLELMERDVRRASQKLLDKGENIRAVIIECSNLASFSFAVQEETGIPTFDLIGAADLLARSVAPPEY
jgi:Asp/Glu/hydantoin racemase